MKINEIQELINSTEEKNLIGTIRDGYHSFNELYEFRKLYNAAIFNEWAKNGVKIEKSYRHNNGELCFGGGWFIVIAETKHGQISNHYESKDWDLFQCKAVEIPTIIWDGHTSKDVVNTLNKIILDNEKI